MTTFQEEVRSTPSRLQAHQLGLHAVELADYQQEPTQMPSGTIGKSGYLQLVFAKRERKSVLANMNRRAPMLVQKALYWDEEMPQLPCVTLISTSGCILQGDRLAMDVHVEANACAHITTQSATKIHTMDANYAAQTQNIVVEQGGYLEFLSDPLIPHRHARFITDTTIKLHPEATVLYSEILMSGRKYHHNDECFGFDVFSSRIAAESLQEDVPQQELFVEKYVLEPHKKPLNSTAIMGPFTIFGNVVLLTPQTHHDRVLARVQSEFNLQTQVAYGASRLPNNSGLIFKVLSNSSGEVKKYIHHFWRIAREEILDITVAEPFIWR